MNTITNRTTKTTMGRIYAALIAGCLSSAAFAQASANKKASVAQAKADRKKTDAQADADKANADANLKDAKKQ